MKRLIGIATLSAALLIPASAVASPAVGAGTNSTSNDAIGWCVSAGNYNYLAVGQTTGGDRSSYAGQPGGVADLIQGARSGFCADSQSQYPPPGSAL